MAISTVNISSPAIEIIFTDTALGNVADGIKGSSAKLYSVTVDNSANGGAATYVKLYNLASGSVTVGTTVPDDVIFVPGGAIVNRTYWTSAAPGVTFGTALSMAALTTGGTAGVTSPASAVVVSVNYV